jgi:uncharacterized protein (DUF2267 family)
MRAGILPASRTKDRNAQEFADHVRRELPAHFPMDPLAVTRGFETLWEKLDPGEFDKLTDHLPASLRTLWPRMAQPS